MLVLKFLEKRGASQMPITNNNHATACKEDKKEGGLSLSMNGVLSKIDWHSMV